jgi:hypothetical protein
MARNRLLRIAAAVALFALIGLVLAVWVHEGNPPMGLVFLLAAFAIALGWFFDRPSGTPKI